MLSDWFRERGMVWDDVIVYGVLGVCSLFCVVIILFLSALLLDSAFATESEVGYGVIIDKYQEESVSTSPDVVIPQANGGMIVASGTTSYNTDFYQVFKFDGEEYTNLITRSEYRKVQEGDRCEVIKITGLLGSESYRCDL